eukprot:TRINITY_DN3524_c0_g2_i1.p1 TRINITY_DN3524_c0_g2~~TRINITY_DN3524_c0_g2_i1.p1  ORF type:complete len:1859 (+),score=702.47 TRINITY_DN3524_c0_g2_i1:461-6037(+)
MITAKQACGCSDAGEACSAEWAVGAAAVAELRRAGESGRVAHHAAQAGQLAMIKQRFTATAFSPSPTPASGARVPAEAPAVVDLAGIGAVDTDMVVIAAMARACERPTVLDLSGNPELRDPAGRDLLAAVEATRAIEGVRLEGTALSAPLAEAIAAACALHAKERARAERRALRRRERRAKDRREGRLREEMVRLDDVECAGRYGVREEWRSQLRALHAAFRSDCEATERKEQRAAMRLRHAQERQQLGREEEARRCGTLFPEEHAGRTLLHEHWEQVPRAGLEEAQLRQRAERKGEEHAAWILARRAEKARHLQEAADRRAAEDEEDHSRQRVITAFCAELATLGSDEDAQRGEALGRQLARETAEAKVRYLKQQEEQRIEKERAWKLEREQREQQRIRDEHTRQRERLGALDIKLRKQLMAEADYHLEALGQLRDIDSRVARARVVVGTAERVRVAAYREVPLCSFRAQPSLSWAFLGDFRVPVAVVGEVELDEELPPPPGMRTAWSDIERRVLDAERALLQELQGALRALRAKGRELGPVLFPDLRPAEGDAAQPHQQRPRPAAAKGPAQLADPAWLKAVDAALESGEGAVLWYDPQHPGERGRPPADEAEQVKLSLVGGTILAWAGPPPEEEAADSWDYSPPGTAEDCGTDRLTCAAKGAQVRQLLPGALEVAIPRGATLGQVRELIQSLQYTDCREERNHFGERALYLRLSLEHPTLHYSAIGPRGCIAGEDALRATCTVHGGAVLPIVIAPPMLVIPPECRLVEFVEDTLADKTPLVADVQVVDPPVLFRSPEGKLVMRPAVAGLSDPSFMGGTLSVMFLENYTSDDLIALKKSGEDDIGVSGSGRDRKLTLGPRGDGPAFAQLLRGELPTHREANDRGEAHAETSPRAGPRRGGFTLRFISDEVHAPTVIKLLKRLRFANFSNNPSPERRVIEVALSDREGRTSRAEILADILTSDDPTQLTLAHSRLVYRHQGPGSIQEPMRHHLRQSTLPLFFGAQVTDPDTDRFLGGSLSVLLCGAPPQKGDIFYVRSCPDGKGAVLKREPDGSAELLFEGRSVGRVLLGAQLPLAADPPSPYVSNMSGLTQSTTSGAGAAGAAAGAAGGHEVVRCTFNADGSASIATVQALVTAVCFTNSLYQPPESWRTVELVLLLGPSCTEQGVIVPDAQAALDAGAPEQQELREKVEVRIAPALFEVPAPHRVLEYREGSGASRIAPMEMPTEHKAFVEQGWTDGSILVEIVEGRNKDDVLNIKAGGSKDMEVKVVLRDSATTESIPHFDSAGLPVEEPPPQPAPEPPPPAWFATPPAQSAPAAESPAEEQPAEEQQEEAPPSPSRRLQRGSVAMLVSPTASLQGEPRTTGLSLMDRLRAGAQRLVAERKAERQNMLEGVRKGIIMQLKYGADERAGKGKTTLSDVFVGSVGPQSLIPAGQMLISPGRLYIRLTRKGLTRKEVLQLLRSLTYSCSSNDPDTLHKVIRITLKDALPVPTQGLVEVNIQSVDDVTQVRLEEPRPRWRPSSLCMHTFGAWPIAGLRRACLEDPDTEHLDGGAITVELVGGGQKGDVLSFMAPEQQRLMRTAAEEYVAAQRQHTKISLSTPIWQVPVWKGELHLDGKRLVTPQGLHVGTLDTGPKMLKVTFAKHEPPKIPLRLASYCLNCVCYANTTEKIEKISTGQRTFQIKIKDAANPVEGKCRLVVDVGKPLVLLPQGAQALTRTAVAGEAMHPFDRAVACVADGKQGAMLQHGFTQVSVLSGYQMGDQLAFATSAQGNLNVSETGAQMGSDFLGRFSCLEADRARLEHSWASKIGTKALQALVGAVQFRSAPTPGDRVVELLCHDGQTDPTCIRVTIKVKEAKK